MPNPLEYPPHCPWTVDPSGFLATCKYAHDLDVGRLNIHKAIAMHIITFGIDLRDIISRNFIFTSPFFLDSPSDNIYY